MKRNVSRKSSPFLAWSGVPGFLAALPAVLGLLASCSEPETVQGIFPVPHGVLLAIDEANQALNVLNLADGTLTNCAVLGASPNDVEVSGDYAYVAASLDGTLTRLDLSNGNVTTLSFASGANPYNLAVDGSRIYVTLSAANALAVVDAASMKIVTNVSLGGTGYPEGVAFDGSYVYLATCDGWSGGYGNGRVTVLDKTTFALVTNVALADNAQSVAVGADGRVYAACTGAYNGTTWSYEGGGLYRIDPSDFGVTNLAADTQVFEVKAYGGLVYALDSAWGTTKLGLTVWSTNGPFVTNLLAGSDLKGLDFDSGHVYVTSAYGGTDAYSIDRSDWSVGTISGVGGGDAALRE